MENIPEQVQKLKRVVDSDFLILLVLILSASLSFSLGYLAGRDGKDEEVRITNGIEVLEEVGEQNFVASVSGSKYHLPWCSGAQRIKEENKLWFSTKENAELAGYEPASNCPGI